MKKKYLLASIVSLLVVLNFYKYFTSSKAEEESVSDNGASNSGYEVDPLKLPNVDKLFTFREYKTETDLFNYYDVNENSALEEPENESDVISDVEARSDLMSQPVVEVITTEVLAVSHHADGSTALLKIDGKTLSVKVGDVLSTGHVVSGIEGTSVIVKDVVQH